MIKNLLLLFLLIAFSTSLTALENEQEISRFKPVIQRFQSAINSNNYQLVDRFVLKQFEYDSVVNRILIKYQDFDCHNPSDINYKVGEFFEQFKTLTHRKIKISNIKINEVESLEKCGADFKILHCSFWYNKNYEATISLVLFKNINNKYRILNQIFNSKYLDYEK